MTTTIAMPGLCGCGRYRSIPHACEEHPTPMRVCGCGEVTYTDTCEPCRQSGIWCPRCLADAGDPECCTPRRLARIVRTKPCGCLVGGDCDHGPDLRIGSAIYGNAKTPGRRGVGDGAAAGPTNTVSTVS